MDENGITNLNLPPPLPTDATSFCLPFDEVPVDRTHLRFTKDDLLQVREDIEATMLPSWMEKVPANFGDASHGKLKADHWRTVGTVNLVITLVRLWGSSTSSVEQLEALKNFIHLVIAVDLASRRSMDHARAATYDYHMEKYLQGLRRTYDEILVPNHHVALHLMRFLQGFGPVHGWWAFPFERYNGMLQRLKTNFKPCE